MLTIFGVIGSLMICLLIGIEIRRFMRATTSPWTRQSRFTKKTPQIPHIFKSFPQVALTGTGGWFFVRGTRSYDYNRIPDEMAETVKDRYGKGETVTHVAIGPGGWVFICGANRYFSAGIPTAMQDALASINAAGSKISCVALAADGGGWLVITKPVRTHHSRQ